MSVLAARQSPLGAFKNCNTQAVPGPSHQNLLGGDPNIRILWKCLFVCLFVFVFVKLLSDSSGCSRQRAIDSEASDAFYHREGLFERQGFQWTTYSHPGLYTRAHLRLFLSSPELFSAYEIGQEIITSSGCSLPQCNALLYGKWAKIQIPLEEEKM